MRDRNGERDAATLLARVVELARAAVRDLRLPSDWADDLAQETMAALLADGLHASSDDAIACTVRRTAQRECSRCRRARRHGAASSPSGAMAPPRLCARLAVLGAHASNPRRYAGGLLDAAHAVAAEPGVLTDCQLRLYQLAYVQAWSVDRLTTSLRISTTKATRKRLYRLSQRIERNVVAAVMPLVANRSRGVLFGALEGGSRQKKNQNVLSADLNVACDELMAAFPRVIHRDPGLAVT